MAKVSNEYYGHKVDTLTEALWAMYFSMMGLKYKYKKKSYHKTDKGTWIKPTFYLPQIDIWVHVTEKESPITEKEKTLLSWCGANPCLLVEGPPKKGQEYEDINGVLYSMPGLKTTTYMLPIPKRDASKEEIKHCVFLHKTLDLEKHNEAVEHIQKYIK